MLLLTVVLIVIKFSVPSKLGVQSRVFTNFWQTAMSVRLLESPETDECEL